MMKILCLSYEFLPLGGGGSRVVHGLTQELAGSGCEIDLVTMSFRGLPRHESLHGVNIHRIRCIRSKTSMSYMAELAVYIILAFPYVFKLAKEKKYDLNHTHFIFPDGVIALILKKYLGIPYIITAHGSDVPGYNPDRFKWAHRFLFPLWKKIVENAERIICPSRGLEALVLRGFSKAKTTIIPNGIRLNSSLVFAKKKSILIVARMFERKGVQYFLKSLENLNLDCEINIVGDGPYLETLKAIANSRPIARVQFRGWYDHDSLELAKLYETSSIFVLLSESENCPIVLLEAMAHSMAIITTEGTGCAEVAGNAAILVPVKDAEAVRKAVCRLTGDDALREKLGQSARRRFEERYQWSIIAGEYRHVYEECQSNNGTKT